MKARFTFPLVLLFIAWQLPVLGFAGPDAITVADLTFTVPGTRAATDWEKNNAGKSYNWPNYFYGFQEGDKMVVELKMEEGKGKYEVDIKEFASGSVLYAGRNISKIKKQEFHIPTRAVYEFIIRSTGEASSTCKMTIKRIPASAATARFNANVTWKTQEDTVFTFANEKVLVKTDFQPQILVDKTFRVFSQASIGKPSRVTVPFKLPANTAHWVYWLGVGQESVKEMEALTKTLAKGGAAIASGMNPVVAFGMGLLPELPQVKSSGYIDFLFMNKQAAAAFEKDGERKPFSFAQGDAIINAYGKIAASQTPKTQDGSLYLGVENHNTVTGLDVAVKIVAFQAEPKYETRKVKKVAKINRTRIPVFGN
ncbi:hypothetical protein I5M27_11465 [Adhaeribacter sp. BT258]|uniref:Uncharacterized protein n=1 Tax=Adhaeribacter terrigena TaxID=2793070 RepID=A0ABS1C4Q2_9BACT|nr:hypothetical protein [Adhaeribacter terrigena]MBK0403608.1 hypothetical protein [Adhaeribacter terrigena]